jgi:hypothetical protein
MIGNRRVPARAGVTVLRAIHGSQGNLKLIDLIPLGIGSLTFRDGHKLLQTTLRGNGLWFIHGDIIPPSVIV